VKCSRRIVHTAAKQVISRLEKNENGSEITPCKACKYISWLNMQICRRGPLIALTAEGFLSYLFSCCCFHLWRLSFHHGNCSRWVATENSQRLVMRPDRWKDINGAALSTELRPGLILGCFCWLKANYSHPIEQKKQHSRWSKENPAEKKR